MRPILGQLGGSGPLSCISRPLTLAPLCLARHVPTYREGSDSNWLVTFKSPGAGIHYCGVTEEAEHSRREAGWVPL